MRTWSLEELEAELATPAQHEPPVTGLAVATLLLFLGLAIASLRR